MVRLFLFVEGQSEQTFANTVLCPHLAEDGVHLHRAVLVANSHKKHRTTRGGVGRFGPMQKDITRFRRQHSRGDVYFTSMIDLYRLPRDFPGFEEAEKHRDDPYRRIRMLEESWARDTGDHRFIPHIQLHEYEAYLFVDVSVLSEYYQGHEQAVAMLEASVEAFDSPELIDDGIETAPSKRIMSHLPGYASDKPTVGVQAAERIGLSAIRQRCSHFSSWLEQIEGLSAQEIG